MRLDCINTFLDLKRCLRCIDYSKLPGLDAQLRMAPELRHTDIKSMGDGRNAMKSSVLILFYPSGTGSPVLVFIQRPEYNGAHSGQISFPGGRYEIDDKDMEYTALRETHEEIGVKPRHVEVLGKLTDLYIPPSNFLVCPYVAVTDERPLFRPDPMEVAGIIEIDFNLFFQKQNCGIKSLTISDGSTIQIPCYIINGHIIWGATAMMLEELLAIFRN
jgi:8-oxo-dGTP pyrophosphatase MutT (NUDIX family)